MSIFEAGQGLFSHVEKPAGHPQQAEQGRAEGERFAEKETGGKDDSQIQDTGDKLEQEVEGQNPRSS